MDFISLLIGTFAGIIGTVYVMTCMKRSYGSNDDQRKRQGTTHLRSAHDAATIRKGRTTLLIWTWCGNGPDGFPVWMFRPILLPPDYPRDAVYHVYRWCKSQEVWRHVDADSNLKDMEGGEEVVTFYSQKRGYDLVANTAGVDISGNTDEPSAPPARVVKEDTREE